MRRFVKIEGTLPQASRTIALSETSATVAGALQTAGKVQRLAASGAQVLASYSGRPVVTYNRYGDGAAIAYAFDLASAPTAQAASNLRAAILKTPASTSHTDAGDVVAVAVNVTNQGLPVEVRLTETVAGGQLVAALDAPPSASPLMWARSLARGEAAHFVYLVRLPDEGEVTATSHVTAALGDTTRDIGTYELTATPSATPAVLLDRALAETRLLSPVSKADEQRRRRVVDTVEQLRQHPPATKAECADAIARLIKAVGETDAMEIDVRDARLALDALLAHYEGRWSL